jgi:hypothetical protein
VLGFHQIVTRDVVSRLESSDTDFFLASPLYRIVLFMEYRHFCEESVLILAHLNDNEIEPNRGVEHTQTHMNI